MNIDLAVNDYSVSLGDAFDFESLKNAGFKKVGLLSKALINTRSGEIVYWAKNCTIECLASRYVAVPQINVGYGADQMFGTSAYLFFMKGHLSRVTFQVIRNPIVAMVHTEEFRKSARALFGPPANATTPW